MSKGFTYTASEVVSLWQAWCNRSMRDYNPDTLSRPGTRDTVDPRQRAFRYVEMFLMAHPHLTTDDKGRWLLGIPDDYTLDAWHAWYDAHPLPRTLSGEQVASIAKDFLPLTVAEAAEHLKCTPRAIQIGAKDGRLFAWRPAGMGWHTNRYWLDKWKAEHPQGWVKGRPRKVA